MDRAWIVDKVFSNDHVDLAISTLNIEGFNSDSQRRVGPRDSARLIELKELDTQIADSERYVGAKFQLVEDCLQSALLARGLERPRSEIEARFSHAARLAKESGPQQQRMRIAYHHAWTTFWWYDDYYAFTNLYDEVEALVQGSNLAADSQRLLNLWQLLHSPTAAGRIKEEDAKIDARCSTLKSMLSDFASNDLRPTNAIQARTQLAMIEATLAMRASDAARLDKSWNTLSQIVDESTSLPSYPIEQLSDVLERVGASFDSPAFDALYEKVVDVIRSRRSEGEAGEAYRVRGVQKLQREKPYEAIQWLGRAEELLLKVEYTEQLVLTLAASSLAYDQVGLLWAARQKILVAAERCSTELFEDGTIGLALARSLNRLVWLELRLGRVSSALTAMSLAHLIAPHLKLKDDMLKAYENELQLQEFALMIHLVRFSFEQLRSVPQLPDVFERLGLTNARLALLFALGHFESIKQEYSDDIALGAEDLFAKMLSQPMADELGPPLIVTTGTNASLKSRILGAEIVMDVASNRTSFGIAESLLGGVEALLATSRPGDIFPRQEITSIEIADSSEHVGMPTVQTDEETHKIKIVHPSNFVPRTGEESKAFRDWLTNTIAVIATKSFLISDFKTWTTKVLDEERALFRAVCLADTLTLDRNIFGSNSKFLLADWVEEQDKAYSLLRTETWHKQEEPNTERPRAEPKLGSGPPPPGMFELDTMKHSDQQFLSPINIDLWDRAQWQAVVFGEAKPAAPTPTATLPPILGLAFKNSGAGNSIFEDWRDRWGTHDKDDALRVAIIRGVSARHPAHYSIIIGPGWKDIGGTGAKTFLMLSRIKTMEPSTRENLDRFLAEYQRVGMYLLMPATLTNPQKFETQLYFAKRELVVKDAWQIGENDPDIVVLKDDDPPLIPPGISDPPVIKALEQIRAMRERNRRS